MGNTKASARGLGCSATCHPKGVIPEKVSDLINDLGFVSLDELTLILGEAGVDTLTEPILLALARNLNEEQIKEFKHILGLKVDDPSYNTIKVDEVRVFPESLTLKVGNSTPLLAVVLPDNASNKMVKWISLDPTVAIVDSLGRVTALTIGKAQIMAVTEDGALMANCELTVEPICSHTTEPTEVKVDSVRLSANTLNIIEGLVEVLKANVSPSNATNKSVTWSSSDPAVVEVNSNGQVMAKKAGSAIITVTTEDGGHTDTCSITVEAATVLVSGITLSKTTLTLVEGRTETLTAAITPEDATNKSIIWSSSDESIATVINGKVTAKKAGSATITAQSSNPSVKALCLLTVEAYVAPVISVTGVTLTDTSLSLTVNSSQVLSYEITPSDATNKGVIWSSSDDTVIAIDSNGRAVAKKAGSATITVTTEDGGHKATCSVIVRTIAVTGIALNKTSGSIRTGATETLIATITPSNATNKTVIWSSSDTGVATVSVNGLVTAKRAGSVTITATTSDGGYKATCRYTVVDYISVTNITLNKTTLSMGKGVTETLVATVLPENATDKNISWSSSDTSIATVDQGGTVTSSATANDQDMVTITATVGGKTASCLITIIDSGIEGVGGIEDGGTDLDISC